MYLERPNNLIEKVSAFTCPIMYIMYFLWEEFERKIEDAHEVQNDEVKYPEKGGSREGNFFPLIHNHLNPQRNSLKKFLEKHTSKVSNNLAKINLWIYLSHCVHNFFFLWEEIARPIEDGAEVRDAGATLSEKEGSPNVAMGTCFFLNTQFIWL